MDHVAVLMRQTQYTREEAEAALQTNTLEACIKQYLEVKEKPPQMVSINQGIFKSIREFIDNVSIDKSTADSATSDNATSDSASSECVS